MAANCKAFIGLKGSPSETITSLPLKDDLSAISSFWESLLLLVLVLVLTLLPLFKWLLLLLVPDDVSPFTEELFAIFDGLLLDSPVTVWVGI